MLSHVYNLSGAGLDNLRDDDDVIVVGHLKNSDKQRVRHHVNNRTNIVSDKQYYCVGQMGVGHLITLGQTSSRT